MLSRCLMMTRYIDKVDLKEQSKNQEIKKLLRDMAVQRYGYSLGHNFNKDRGRWESIRTIYDTICTSNAPFEVVKEALEDCMKKSPEFFPKAQSILNAICVIQTRIVRQNDKPDKKMLEAKDENLLREKAKSEWVKKIGINNVLKAEQDYKQVCNLPNSTFFNNALWGGYNRQEIEALDILKGYEEKNTTRESN